MEMPLYCLAFMETRERLVAMHGELRQKVGVCREKHAKAPWRVLNRTLRGTRWTRHRIVAPTTHPLHREYKCVICYKTLIHEHYLIPQGVEWRYLQPYSITKICTQCDKEMGRK
jgi:hypothetical protein